ncbi:MAG: GNAT family N-acetyltransferase [Eubacteriales bacterium]|nr:GNAT family N-acetyltransferase [Eubacteriales bacterium]
MYIETQRLIIRNFTEQDAEELLEIKYDEQVLKYDPTFIKRNATIDDIKKVIEMWRTTKEDDIYTKGIHYAICLKNPCVVIGAITVNPLEYLYELQIGWMMNSKYTGKGYASEAGAAASDYLLETLSLDYISVVMDVDNPASFRTAQKSGFRLFEKRFPYDYHYSKCDVNDFNDVGEHFYNKQNEIGSCYYYFRKFNKNSQITSRFYGDTKYDGRFS